MFVVRWGWEWGGMGFGGGMGMGLVTLCFVRGLFSDAVSIDRFLRTFVFVFRFPNVCPGDFLILRCCFVVGIYRI